MVGRPRRSAAAAVVSYAIPSIDELQSASDTEHGSDAQPDEPTTATAKGKGKAKAQPKSKPKPTPKGKGPAGPKHKVRRAYQSDSGSDFGESLAKEAAEQESTSDDQLEADEVEEEDDGLPVEEADDEDVVEVRATAAATLTPGGGRKPRKSASAPHPQQGLPPTGKSTEPSCSRVTAPAHLSAEEADLELVAFGPLFEPPRSRTLGLDSGSIVEGLAFTEEQRETLMQNWAESPFFLPRSLLADTGWAKGKWTDGGVSERWGGWSEGTKEQQFRVVPPK